MVVFMPRRPKSDQARERVQNIIQSAEELFAKKGLASVTTNHIAKKAGVPIGSVYQYFKDKNAILVTILHKDLEEMSQIVDERIAAKHTSFIKAVSQVALCIEQELHQRPLFKALVYEELGNVDAKFRHKLKKDEAALELVWQRLMSYLVQTYFPSLTAETSRFASLILGELIYSYVTLVDKLAPTSSKETLLQHMVCMFKNYFSRRHKPKRT